MRIVLVHGRAAEMEIPALARIAWEAAMRYGLERIGSGFAVPKPNVDVRYAFYGHVWRPDEQQPLPQIANVPVQPQFALPGFNEISYWLDEHFGIGDDLLEGLLTDVDGYYTEPRLHKATNDIVRTAITEGLAKKEKVILVGFSMGSLVAYDLLRAEPKLPVLALITCGSPIAMPSFYRRVSASAPKNVVPPTPFPSQLDVWVNVWTQQDPGTAGHARIPDLFRSPGGVKYVQDLETWGRTFSPISPAGAHNALDYLSSRVLATALDACLTMLAAA